MCSRISATPPLSFIRLSTQFENVGDCLINRELVRLVSEQGEVCLDTRSCPSGFARQVEHACPSDRLRTPSWSFYGEMLRQRCRRRSCYWFLMPGAITAGGRREGRFRSLLRDVPLWLAALIGVRVCQVGVSFGELSNSRIAVWRRRRRYLFRLSPRDQMSATSLRSGGIAPDPVIPDLSFELFSTSSPALHNRPSLPRTACLSFRTDQYASQLDEVAAVAHAVCRNSTPDTTWRPLVQVARDRPGMECIRSRLTESGFALPPVEDLHFDVERCLEFYRGQSLVVSNRLHALLMGASQGARILAVAEGPGGDKLRGILFDLGLQEALVDLRCLTRAGTTAQPGMFVDGRSQREQLRIAFDELFRPRNVSSIQSSSPRER